ncbi:MAG: DUF1385 domain-containing protein [Lachnospiraceae bacterium]|nr:DUF1385 domain-containing protein [Lachnospiraceae bacterium]
MASKKRKKVYSGIGGQAVIEGIMMRNREKYAIVVRRPDGKLEIETQTHQQLLAGSPILKIPFVRGAFVFIDSMILGTRAINYSASVFDEEEAKDNGTSGSGALDGIMSAVVMIIAIALAVGLFILLPTFLASLFEQSIRNPSLVSIIEGCIRILVFVLYMFVIGFLKDMRRIYRYHGAEHKCINCIERGRTLNVENVKKSSRFHRRCGTSFMYISVFISVIIFFFIRIEYLPLRLLVRILLIPVVLGISYEILALAGKSENIFVYMLTAPGIWFQHLTTKEPDDKMIEVAIKSVEAVFDWKKYLADNFGLEINEEGEIVGAVPGWGDEYEEEECYEDDYEGEEYDDYPEEEEAEAEDAPSEFSDENIDE